MGIDRDARDPLTGQVSRGPHFCRCLTAAAAALNWQKRPAGGSLPCEPYLDPAARLSGYFMTNSFCQLIIDAAESHADKVAMEIMAKRVPATPMPKCSIDPRRRTPARIGRHWVRRPRDGHRRKSPSMGHRVSRECFRERSASRSILTARSTRSSIFSKIQKLKWHSSAPSLSRRSPTCRRNSGALFPAVLLQNVDRANADLGRFGGF